MEKGMLLDKMSHFQMLRPLEVTSRLVQENNHNNKTECYSLWRVDTYIVRKQMRALEGAVYEMRPRQREREVIWSKMHHWIDVKLKPDAHFRTIKMVQEQLVHILHKLAS